MQRKIMDYVSKENYYNQLNSLGKRRKQVFNALRKLKRATSWELLNYFGWINPNMVRPRLTELKEMGLIKKIGKVKVNGILQNVWTICD